MNERGEGAPERRVRYEHLPVVVIAGRPNVGKSTLFNRLLHRRRAITDPTPGVTRDAVDAVWEIGGEGRRARLFDTGGFKLEREGLDGLVVERSLSALASADLIIFLLDATAITPEDEEFAALLRRWSPKVLPVVNKADSPERDSLVWDHARWGFAPPLHISAEHGRNVGELAQAVASRLDFSRIEELDESRAPIRLAIMGKPNTGKSTLLNRLLGEERSIVSEIAGTTRDVVEGSFEFKGRRFAVLDTAGIRRKSKVVDAVEYYSVNRAIRTVDECDVVVLLIDAAEGLTEQDKKIAAFAAEKARGIVFALNKWDAMPDLKNSFEAARDRLRYFFGQLAYVPVLAISAKEGTGVDKLLGTVVTVNAQLTKPIETSRLNERVGAWIEETPPPVGTRTRFKVRYAVQTSTNPQKFVFFVTRPDVVAESYVAFLRNKIRSELGLDKIPVLLELKASRVPFGGRGASRGRDGGETRLMVSHNVSPKPEGGDAPRRPPRASGGESREGPGATRKVSEGTREAAGASRKAAGTSRKAGGTSREARGASRKAAGTSRKAGGTSRKAAGTSRKAGGSSRKTGVTSRKAAGSRPASGKPGARGPRGGGGSRGPRSGGKGR